MSPASRLRPQGRPGPRWPGARCSRGSTRGRARLLLDATQVVALAAGAASHASGRPAPPLPDPGGEAVPAPARQPRRRPSAPAATSATLGAPGCRGTAATWSPPRRRSPLVRLSAPGGARSSGAAARRWRSRRARALARPATASSQLADEMAPPAARPLAAARRARSRSGARRRGAPGPATGTRLPSLLPREMAGAPGGGGRCSAQKPVSLSTPGLRRRRRWRRSRVAHWEGRQIYARSRWGCCCSRRRTQVAPELRGAARPLARRGARRSTWPAGRRRGPRRRWPRGSPRRWRASPRPTRRSAWRTGPPTRRWRYFRERGWDGRGAPAPAAPPGHRAAGLVRRSSTRWPLGRSSPPPGALRGFALAPRPASAGLDLGARARPAAGTAPAAPPRADRATAAWSRAPALADGAWA